MSKSQKALEKLLKLPPPADLTWDELTSVIKSFGLKIENGSGSRRHFVGVIDGRPVRFSTHKPHPNEIVKKYAIEAVREWLKEKNLI